MSTPSIYKRVVEERDALRAEVAALACRVERLAMDLGRSEAREAEARAEVKRLQDPEALGPGWHTARAWKAKHDEAREVLVWIRRLAAGVCDPIYEYADAFLRRDERPGVCVDDAGNVICGPECEHGARDEARRCTCVARTRSEGGRVIQLDHANTCPARDEARRWCACGGTPGEPLSHLPRCPARDEAPGGD